MRYLAVVLLVGTLAACSGARFVGSAAEPYCAADGSVVWVVYANSAGSYDGAKASPKNCPWSK